MSDGFDFNGHEYWQKRAATFGGSGKRSNYVATVIERIGLPPESSVLDMGCATGTLAIPLALDGRSVLACDFASNMLSRLEELAFERGANVTTKLLDWNEDWEAAGIEENSVDIAIASRSLPTSNPRPYLEKLERAARKRVAVSVSGSSLPARDPKLCAFIGREVPEKRDDVVVLDELAKMGRQPSLSYIPCERPLKSESREWIVYELRKMAGREELSSKEEGLFEEFVDRHVRRVEIDGSQSYRLDYELIVRWALIQWDL